MSGMNINSVTFGGFVGGNAECKVSQAGKNWCYFTLCYTDKKDGDNGQKQDVTTWVKVYCFGYAYEVGKCVKKGDNVIITDGKLQISKWKAQDGTEKTSTDIIVYDGRKIGQVLRHKKEQQPAAAPANAGTLDDIPF